MSEKLSDKQPAAGQSSQWLRLLGYCLWVALCFVGVQLLVGLVLAIMAANGVLDDVLMQDSASLIVRLITFVIMGLMVIYLPKYLWGEATRTKTLGLQRLANWRDLGLGLVGVLAAFAGSVLLLWLSQRFMPWVDIEQTQDLGVASMSFGSELALAFIVFVVVGPFIEELIFRGYFYGKLRETGLTPWLTALVVSALFGLAHWQWNVGLDVFVLSLVMCYMREKTGAIWAGVLMHMIKNGIAFYFVFIYPMTIGL